MSRCRIPTAAVAQRGLFRILQLLGGNTIVADVKDKADWTITLSGIVIHPLSPSTEGQGFDMNASYAPVFVPAC